VRLFLTPKSLHLYIFPSPKAVGPGAGVPALVERCQLRTEASLN
jgi:hypothetical protein